VLAPRLKTAGHGECPAIGRGVSHIFFNAVARIRSARLRPAHKPARPDCVSHETLIVRIYIAGKNKIAVEAAEFVRRQPNLAELWVMPNAEDSGIDTWQPSLRKWAKVHQVPIVCLDDVYPVADLLFMSLEFDTLIAPARFRSAKLFNIHFSLLPQYKGAYTAIWPLLDGKDYTGVTLHKIDKGIDTGDIIDQERISIALNDTSRTVYDKYLDAGYRLFETWLPRLLAGNFVALPQPADNSSFRSRSSIDFLNLKIELKQTAFAVHNQIRAFTFREYQLPSVYGWPISKSQITRIRSVAKPGAIVEDNDRFMQLATIDYDLIVYKDAFELLLRACERGAESEVRFYGRLVENLNMRNSKGWSPLMVAAYHNNLAATKALVELGADLNQTNYKGTTVAMFARSGATAARDLSCLRFLLERGAEVNAPDLHGRTILSYAVAEPFPELTELLRAWGVEK